MIDVDENDTEMSLDDAPLRRPWLVVVVVTLLLMSLGVWASQRTVQIIVRAEARVVPSVKSQLVQHLEGGVLAQISVREGSVVQKGQLLARIADDLASSNVGEMKVRSEGLLARSARLQAEASGSKSITFPDEVDPKSVAAQSEIDAFNARQRQLTNEISALREVREQRRNEISEYQRREKSMKRELALAQKQLTVIEDLIANRAASKLELLDAQAKVERFKSQIDDIVTTYPRLRSSVAESQAKISEAQRRFAAEAQVELTAVMTELKRIEEDARGDQDRLRRTDLLAPVSGVINRVFVSTVGGVLKPGEALMEITPLADYVVLEGKVSPADRADLHPGQKTKVRISAFDFRRYGNFDGEVSDISADTFPDENGQRYYRIRVDLQLNADQSQREVRLAKEQILPGMTATIDVISGERTVLAFVTDPILRYFETAMRETR